MRGFGFPIMESMGPSAIDEETKDNIIDYASQWSLCPFKGASVFSWCQPFECASAFCVFLQNCRLPKAPMAPASHSALASHPKVLT